MDVYFSSQKIWGIYKYINIYTVNEKEYCKVFNVRYIIQMKVLYIDILL